MLFEENMPKKSMIEQDPKEGFLFLINKTTTYDVILLDYEFTGRHHSGKEGFHWLKQILKGNRSKGSSDLKSRFLVM